MTPSVEEVLENNTFIWRNCVEAKWLYVGIYYLWPKHYTITLHWDQRSVWFNTKQLIMLTDNNCIITRYTQPEYLFLELISTPSSENMNIYAFS